MDEPWTKSMPLCDCPSDPKRRTSSGSMAEPVLPDVTSSQMSPESSRPVARTEEDPFYVFGLPPHFNISEESLRTSYFRLCKESVQDPARLSELHRLYRSLTNPCQRFDAVCCALGLALPPPSDELPADILALSEACLDDAIKEDTGQLIAEKRMLLEHEIQLAFERADKQQLSQLRLRLGYLWRMAKTVSSSTSS